MRALFSMLFGAGVVLLTQRAEERGGLRARGIYYRRTLWLVVFGLLHTYFIWIGDILYFYGVVGLMLFPLRKLRPATLLVAGALLLMIVCGITTLTHHSLIRTRDQALAVDRLVAAGGQPTEEQRAAQKEWEEESKEIKPDSAELAKEIKLHRGGYWELFKWRIKEVPLLQAALLFPFVSFLVHDSPGMMLIGMAMLKLGIITAERDRKFYLLMILLGYGIGGTINAITGYYFARSGFDLGKESLAWRLASEPGRLLVAGGHIGLVMLIVKSGWLKRLTSRLAAVGQMALIIELIALVGFYHTVSFFANGLRLPSANSSTPLVADNYLCNPLLNRFQGFGADLTLLFRRNALVERRGRKGVRKIREDAQRYLLVTRIGQRPRRGHGVMGQHLRVAFALQNQHRAANAFESLRLIQRQTLAHVFTQIGHCGIRLARFRSFY